MNGPYAEMVHEHFMKLVPPTDHKFACTAWRSVVRWFLCLCTEGSQCGYSAAILLPLKCEGRSQFEHTLIIVDEGADLHFIEGCSAPKYNVANLHAGCVELFIGKNAKLRYSTIKTGRRICITLIPSVPWLKRAVLLNGFPSSGSHVSYLSDEYFERNRRA